MIDKKWLIAGLAAQTVVAGVLGALLVISIQGWRDQREGTAALERRMLEHRYEYKVVTVAPESLERTGDEAMKAASISVNEKELSALGNQGWEIVGSYLELETAYPNFGDAKYVTGLQTNVRPQRLVLILRHRIG